MAKEMQTVILETSNSLRNSSTVLELCTKVIDNYFKETFTGMTDEEIIQKVKTFLN